MKIEIRFDPGVKIILTPENQDEQALLALGFNGKTVTSIKGDSETGIVLSLGKSGE